MAPTDLQRAYLDAMGIQVWVRRDAPGSRVDGAAVGSQAPAVEPATAAGSGLAAEVSELDWQALRQQVQTCTRCELHGSRTHAVFGVGDPQADWMVVGEAPGAEEDRQGEPFVGRAGQLLNAMLYAVGLQRKTVYIANILKCRPPNNRDPRPEEALCCRPYLQRQVALVAPRLMLAVGRVAAQNLLDTDAPLGRLRGRVHRYGAAGTPLVVTYHPAYLLRSPGEKRKAWQDLLLARRAVGGVAGGDGGAMDDGGGS